MTTVQMFSREDMVHMSERSSVFSVRQDKASVAPRGRNADDGASFLAALSQLLAPQTTTVNTESYRSLADSTLADNEKRSDLSTDDFLNVFGMLLAFMAITGNINMMAHADAAKQGMSGLGQAEDAWERLSNTRVSLLNALFLESSSSVHGMDGKSLDSFFTALKSILPEHAQDALFFETHAYAGDSLQKMLGMMQNAPDDPRSLKTMSEWFGLTVKGGQVTFDGATVRDRLPSVLSALVRTGALTNDPSDALADERAPVSNTLTETFLRVTSLVQNMHRAYRVEDVNKLLEALRQRYEAFFQSIERLDNEQTGERLSGRSDHPPRVTDELSFLQSRQLLYGADLWHTSEQSAQTPSLPAPLKALLLHIQATQQGRAAEVVHLRLEPETLGELWIRIHVEGQSVYLMVMASKESAGTWLKTHGRELKASLEGQGLQLVRMDISTAPSEERDVRFTFDQGGDKRKDEREERGRTSNASSMEDDFKDALEMAVT
ncbi:MAG: flagellar hook-length control protein FliK [Candidatus Carbobacillus sp.]|nr:flagellar hook-length control protein FliK [Candidatus Carbobacillus sp.]